jgi:caffeoyl-CoA O-methyltransferase
MNGFTETRVEKYMDSMLPPRDVVLREMERYAAKRHVPIVGPACGRLLYQIARLGRARRIFEMGSAIGYSTLWLARAVGPRGTVYYTDRDPANARRAQASFQRAGVLNRVRILVGDALETLKSTKGQFDLVFNDVNKKQYPEVFRLAIPRLRPEGLFISDNVLWHGRVVQIPARDDADTRAILEFNRLVYKASKLFTTIVPLRDGLAICMKTE